MIIKMNKKSPYLYNDIDGWFTFSLQYNKMIRKYPNGNFIEVGCWLGKSSVYLLEKMKELQSNGFVYFVDTWLGSPTEIIHQKLIKENGQDYIYNKFLHNIQKTGCNNYNVIRGDSVEVSKKFQDNSIDFIFIDADHTEEAVYNDLKAWYPKVKNNCDIMGHDIDYNPVKRAVEKFCLENNIERYHIYGSPDQCWHIVKGV